MKKEREAPFWLLFGTGFVALLGFVAAVDLQNQDGYILINQTGNESWDINWNTTKPQPCNGSEVTRYNGLIFECINVTGSGFVYADYFDQALNTTNAPAFTGLTSTTNIVLDGTTNAFMILDRAATNRFAAFQFQTGGVTTATVGTYNTGNENLYFNLDSADAGRRQAMIMIPNIETVFNEQGGDHDFRIEGDAETHLLFADAGLDRVGVGTNTPGYLLDVDGQANAAELCINGDCRTAWPTIGGISTSKVLNILSAATTDTNAPLAARAFLNTWFTVCANSTGYSHYRYGFARAAGNGAAGYTLTPHYANTTVTSLALADWALLNGTDPGISLATANRPYISPVYGLDTQGDHCFGFRSAGGDGVLDPQFRNVWLELIA